MRVIGIDPGKSGGIAWCNAGYMQAWPMPKTEQDIFSLLRDMKFDDSICFIEKLGPRPITIKGRTVRSPSNEWKLATHYGFLRGCLVSLKIPFEEVPPSKWQKALGCLSKGDKNIPKQKAQQLFPDLKITLKTADAVLLCEYGRRIQAGL